MVIKLGQKIKDTVSGFEGTAVAITKWLNGCIRVLIQPVVKKDGTLPEALTFDEPQLVVLKKPKKKKITKTGGPIPNAVQHPSAIC